MRATYMRQGKPFARYGLAGDSRNAELLRLMVWATAANGWHWILED